MTTLNRRKFLSTITSTAGAVLLPAYIANSSEPLNSASRTADGTCWLEVTAPFVLEDAELGIHSEIVLTSDNFSGRDGHAEGTHRTEYEILLFDASGSAVGKDGVARRLSVPAMRTTVIPVRELVGENKSFFGGMTVRLRPQSPSPTHASDLFSSAYIRWKSRNSFDNVHANPDPIQWQRPDSFFYSMPFPSLDQYDCVYCLFNPYKEASTGTLSLYDSVGKRYRQISYNVRPRSSMLVDVRSWKVIKDLKAGLSGGGSESPRGKNTWAPNGGTVAVVNEGGSMKNFGYLMIKRIDSPRFSLDHPIHQSPFVPEKKAPPFDAEGRFRVKNILYTPLVFRRKQVAGITLESKFHFSSGAPTEEHLWLKPLVTGSDGTVAWQHTEETQLPDSITRTQIERGAVKLGGQQSCIVDFTRTSLQEGFSGGLSLATAPFVNHSLMKVEICVPEWDAHAFTHFRPGLSAAKAYQKFPQRGGLVTDYVCSAARVAATEQRVTRDGVIAVMNIDDSGEVGEPTLEVFTSDGLIDRVALEKIPGFGCRHFVLSELTNRLTNRGELTLRLTDPRTILIMSVVHIDYERRDIALDHGSDRFSTYQDFNCNPGR